MLSDDITENRPHKAFLDFPGSVNEIRSSEWLLIVICMFGYRAALLQT